MRTAAAVLAARGRPDPSPRRRARIRSAWEVLPEIVPELTEWSALFASGAPRRARAEAGIEGAATRRDADDLIRDVAMFLRLVERMLVLQPILPQPRQEGRQEAHREGRREGHGEGVSRAAPARCATCRTRAEARRRTRAGAPRRRDARATPP